MREEKIGRLREMNRFVASSSEVAEDQRRLGRFYFVTMVMARKYLTVLWRLLEFIKKSFFLNYLITLIIQGSKFFIVNSSFNNSFILQFPNRNHLLLDWNLFALIMLARTFVRAILLERADLSSRVLSSC